METQLRDSCGGKRTLGFVRVCDKWVRKHSVICVVYDTKRPATCESRQKAQTDFKRARALISLEPRSICEGGLPLCYFILSRRFKQAMIYVTLSVDAT